MSEIMLDVGQANELKLAFRRAGYTNADIKKMCKGDVLAQMLPVIRSFGKVDVVSNIIDCDANPSIPQGWHVEEHRKGGELKWDPAKVKFYLSSSQMNGKVVEGNKLRLELEHEPVLNANISDYLLAHPNLIPDEWGLDEDGNVRHIFFWGTIYGIYEGELFVRCICRCVGKWEAKYYWLGHNFNKANPAVRFIG
ncbi:MAG: hypothetical protein AAB482_03600 [Patescibacteria group bacterium]